MAGLSASSSQASASGLDIGQLSVPINIGPINAGDWNGRAVMGSGSAAGSSVGGKTWLWLACGILAGMGLLYWWLRR